MALSLNSMTCFSSPKLPSKTLSLRSPAVYMASTLHTTSKILPNPESEGFCEQVKELREKSKEIPDDYFVVLVGDMITEEALPTYQTMLNTLDGDQDETGASLTSWAIWTRVWTAEENRHGDLLNKYLYLSGRVDMKQIEGTIQYLIGSGMDPKTETTLAWVSSTLHFKRGQHSSPMGTLLG